MRTITFNTIDPLIGKGCEVVNSNTASYKIGVEARWAWETYVGGRVIAAIGTRILRAKTFIKAPKSVPKITFKPKWSGQVQRYRKGDMTAIEHITSRHGYNSGYSNVSKFSEGTSVKNITSMVDEAAARGTFTQTRKGSTITHDFGRTIGTNQAGQSTSRITIHLDSSGSVKTAYPY